MEGLGPPKIFKNEWFDVLFAFPWPPLSFCIAFALPSRFLFLSNGGLPLAIPVVANLNHIWQGNHGACDDPKSSLQRGNAPWATMYKTSLNG